MFCPRTPFQRPWSPDCGLVLGFALGFTHELFQARDIPNLKVASLAANESDRGEPAQLARNRLAMRADSICNIGERWCWRDNGFPMVLR